MTREIWTMVEPLLPRDEMSFDEGKQVLDQAAPRLTRHMIGMLSKRAQHHGASHPDAAELYLRWAAYGATLLDQPDAIAYCAADLGEFLDQRGKLEDAMAQYEVSLPFYVDGRQFREFGDLVTKAAKCEVRLGKRLAAIRRCDASIDALRRLGFAHEAKYLLYPFLAELSQEAGDTARTAAIKAELAEVTTALHQINDLSPAFAKAQKLIEQGWTLQALRELEAMRPAMTRYGQPRDIATFLLSMGGASSDAGRLSEAFNVLERAADLYASVDDRLGAAKAKKTIASRFEDQGRYQEAKCHYESVLAIFHAAGEREATARALNDLGVLYKNLNLHIDAFRQYAVARVMVPQDSNSPDAECLTQNIDVLTSTIAAQLSGETAMKVRALIDRGELAGAAFLLEHAGTPLALDPPTVDSDFTIVEHDSVRKRAHAFLRQREVRAAVHELSAAGHTALERAGDPATAIEDFARCVEWSQCAGLGYLTLLSKSHLGNAFLLAGQHAAAVATLNDVIADASQSDVFPILWKARARAAKALAAMGDADGSLDQLAAAVDEIEDRCAALFHIRGVEGFFEDKLTVYQHFVDQLVALGRREEAYQVVRRAKAWPFATLMDAVRRAKQNWRDDAAQRQLTTMQRFLDEILTTGEGLVHGNQATANAWFRETAVGEVTTRVMSELLESVQPAIGKQATTTVTPSIDEMEVLIDLFIGHNRLHVFMVSADSLELETKAFDADGVFGHLGTVGLPQLMSTGRSLDTLVSVKAILREQLALSDDAMRKRLEGTTWAATCAHGFLNCFSASTLRDALLGGSVHPTTPSALASSLPHASFCGRLGSKTGRDSLKYFGLGNPDGSLPGAADEVEAAGHWFDPARRRLVVGQPISRQDSLRHMAWADVIHLACHGCLRVDFSELSYLDFGGRHRLHVSDLMGGAIVNADLVILSACSTHLGRISAANEVGSLGRSFLYAGAKRVLATLWPIDDQGTMRMIDGFFRRWQRDGMTIRVAYGDTVASCSDIPLVAEAFTLIEAE